MTTSKNGSSAANAEYLELVMSFLLDTIGDELGAYLVRPIISIDDRVARGIGREGSQGTAAIWGKVTAEIAHNVHLLGMDSPYRTPLTPPVRMALPLCHAMAFQRQWRDAPAPPRAPIST